MRGFAHRCPHCGEANGLRLHLDDVSVLTCSSCDNEVTAGEIKEIISQWERMLLWIGSAPTRKDA